MSAEAFTHQIDYIKTFYQRTDERVQATYTREYRFLDRQKMDRFVDDSVAALMRVYDEIVSPVGETGAHRSVMTLLNL